MAKTHQEHQHDHSHNHSHDGSSHGSGHISTPCCGTGEAASQTVTQTVTLRQLKESVVSTFLVAGMDCADEVIAIQKSLNISGVGKVSANLMSSKVVVEHEKTLSASEIRRHIEKAGVRVRQAAEPRTFYRDNYLHVWSVATAGLFLLLGFGSEAVLGHSFGATVLYLIAAISGSFLVVPKAIRSIRQKALDMNVLMVIAVTGAFMIGEYLEAATVIFLFSVSELLEAVSVARARRAIGQVVSIVPETAQVIRNEKTEPVSVSQVLFGDVMIVRSGERIPLDGTVLEGNSYVNQAPLTGESEPIEKNPGDFVLAGTINTSGTLRVRVDRLASESKIAEVIRLVEEAQSQRAPTQRFVDRFAKIYTPTVAGLGFLIAVIPPLLFSQEWVPWLYRSMVFLVIACPCALVIATPIAIVSALTALARAGVLVKGGAYLEDLGKLKVLALDKTGTMTEGVPKVVSVKYFQTHENVEDELLMVVHSLESESLHPLAKAAVSYSKLNGGTLNAVSGFVSLHGLGVEGRIGDHLYFVGNHKLAHSYGVCSVEVEEYLASIENKSQSVLVVGHKPHDGCPGEIIGVLGLSDEPRAEILSVIQELRNDGLEKVVALSGDNQRTVSAIAKRVGVDLAKGDLMPEDKVREIEALIGSHQYVGMIGDGINDAPALARATVGIAMGALGTDAAIESADVALMADDLRQLPRAIRTGRRMLGIIRFNISFAILIKIIFLALGAVGYTSLWLAVAADTGATLLVIANSVRLLRQH